MSSLEEAGIRVLVVKPNRHQEQNYVTVDFSGLKGKIKTEEITLENGSAISRDYLTFPPELDLNPKDLIADLARLVTFVEITYIKAPKQKHAGEKPRYKDHRRGWSKIPRSEEVDVIPLDVEAVEETRWEE